MRDENAEFAMLSQSRVYENLSFRANVIAYLKACVLYVANGEKWDKTIEEFVRWSFHYDMWCKMEFFGGEIENAMNAIRVRQAEGMNAEGAEVMLRQWMHRRYVTIVTSDNKRKSIYRKLKFRNDGIDLTKNRKR